MKPYYQDEYVTLYHGDCREVLLTIVEPVAVLTDQPYGTGWVRGGGDVGVFTAKHERPEWDRWDLAWIGLVPNALAGAVFGPASKAEAMLAGLPRPNSLSWWRKTNPRPNGPDREPICIWPAQRSETFEAYNGDTPFHPCQKPLELMLWLANRMPDSATLLDPFAGSGTTLRAAKDLGRKAIGIEIEEKYCEIAARRMSQGVLALGGEVEASLGSTD